eukprot:Opistho-2@31490
MAAIDAGYNVALLAFYISAQGPVDMALVWSQVTQARQVAAINYAHAKGAIVMISAGGQTDLPWSKFSTGEACRLFASGQRQTISMALTTVSRKLRQFQCRPAADRHAPRGILRH